MARLITLRLLESYFRHRWLYLLPCVLFTLVAFVYISQMPPVYIARGTVYVQDTTLLSSLMKIGPNNGSNWITPAKATTTELYELLNTKAFVRALVERTDLEIKVKGDPATANETINEAKDALWVQAIGENLVLIGAAHKMPRTAHQLVSATFDTYTQWKNNLNMEESLAAQQFFSDLIEKYRAEVEPARQELAAYLADHPRPLRGDRPEDEVTEITRLQTTVDLAEERLQHVQLQEEQARLALVKTESDIRQTYMMLDAPTRPLEPERSLKEMAMILAIFMATGVFLSGMGVVGGALLDQTFRMPVDITQVFEVPVLALVPEVSMEPITIGLPSSQPEMAAGATQPAFHMENGQQTPQLSMASALHKRSIQDSSIAHNDIHRNSASINHNGNSFNGVHVDHGQSTSLLATNGHSASD